MEIVLARPELNKVLGNTTRLLVNNNEDTCRAYVSGNRLMVYVDAQYGQYIAYLNSEVDTESEIGFSFKPKMLSDKLKGQPASISLKIDKDDGKLTINDGEAIEASIEKESRFRELSESLEFKQFKNPDEFKNSLESANDSFTNDRNVGEFANYLKLSSSHMNVFHPNFSIAKVFSESFLFDFLAIDKRVINTFVNSLNKNDTIEYIDSKNVLMVRTTGSIEGYFTFKSIESVEFPSIRALKPRILSSFSFDTQKFKSIIKKIKVSETERLIFEPNDDKKTITIFDSENRGVNFDLEYDGDLKRSVFSSRILKCFEKLLTKEETTLSYCSFDSAATENGYLWFLEDPVMAYMPGITEASPERFHS